MGGNMAIMAGWPARDLQGRDSRRAGVNIGNQERFLSGLGGGALLLIALRLRGAPRIALTVLGGALVTRAASGRSEVYRWLGNLPAARRGRQGSAAVKPIAPKAIQLEESVTIAK